MALIHVDERDGSDATGQGTPENPYQSLAFALHSHGSSAQTLIRKDSSSGYEEPTQSALKKAKKGAEGIEKKKKKQEEIAQRDLAEKKEERERKEKLLEGSKQIVLVEDPGLPEAVRVCDKVLHISCTNVF
jgi:asparaginyl-tRNA synthetase